MSHIISDGEKSISRRDLITRASGLAVAAVVPPAISGSREPAWAGSAQEAFPASMTSAFQQELRT